MMEADLIITDSGGIQEEAPSFHIPTIITRDATEREEGIEAGFNHLAGTNGDVLKSLFKKLLIEDREQLLKLVNPYGDGWSSQKIVTIIENYLNAR
jgi:UDP-N-acetylglucosamine 2-epimerase (non-hydrolysing)